MKPERKTEVIRARVSKTLKTEIETMARRHNLPFAWIVNEILERHAALREDLNV